MGVFNLFRKSKQREDTASSQESPQETSDLELYSDMWVEVTTLDSQLLFVAKLKSWQMGMGQLHQYSETALPVEEEPLQVQIRGYNDQVRKAVYMEGTISSQPQRVWQVENLVVKRVSNDRAFFRLETHIETTATTVNGPDAGEKSCKLLNISVGGACISSQCRYQEGDKFLLKVKLLEDRETSSLYCQVLRVTDRGGGRFEYGCRFLELNEADQDRITQNIFAVQRQKRSGSR